MKKMRIKNLIIFSLLLLASNAAFCYTLESSELKAIIEKQLKAQINDPDTQISISGVPYEKIVTIDSTRPKVEIIPQNPNFKRVMVKDAKNNTVKTFSINIQTKTYKNVLVATAQIPFGAEINSANSRIEKKEVSRILNNVIFEPVQGVSAARNYPVGSIIQTNGIKQKPIVLKNSIIDIVFLSSKGLKITLQGKALKDGGVGETILVRSDKYNKTYNAIVNSNRTVTVRI